MSLSDITPGPYSVEPPTENPLMMDVGHYRLSFFKDYIKTIADKLSAGKTSIVTLEPGDGTRYAFYLIPQVGDQIDTYRFGDSTNPWEKYRAVWISPINLDTTGGMIVFMNLSENIYYDLSNYTNPHTKVVITIFLDLVYQSISGMPLVPLDCFSKSE